MFRQIPVIIYISSTLLIEIEVKVKDIASTQSSASLPLLI
jgi:hypothetical protein